MCIICMNALYYMHACIVREQGSIIDSLGGSRESIPSVSECIKRMQGSVVCMLYCMCILILCTQVKRKFNVGEL